METFEEFKKRVGDQALDIFKSANSQKEKLANLTESQLQDRNKYLKDLANGKIQGPLTGFPSLDKIWLKYYSDTALDKKKPKCTMYDYIYNANKDHLDNPAIIYYNRVITYRELFANIDKTAASLKAKGVNANDIISVCLPNTPESVYILYAVSKIGAIANMIDPRSSVEIIKHYIKEVDSKVVITLDAIAPKIYPSLKDLNIKDLVLVNATNSLENIPAKQREIANGVNECNFSQFIIDGQKYAGPLAQPYQENKPVVIEHTGGTTGIPKGVLLSNDAMNMIAHHFQISNLKFDRNQKWLNIMPPFIAYGVGNGLHLPLAIGMAVIEVPKFEPEKIDELILNYNPNNFTGVPLHYECLSHSKNLEDYDFSKWVLAGVGGDSMETSLEEKVNDFFKNHNGNLEVTKGYGLTEVGAAATVSFCNSNTLGSVGIPFVHNNVGIFKNDTDEEIELGYNMLGEVCISSPSVMQEYFHNSKETNHVLKKHKDGKIWMHSGDLGYIDSNGRLFIAGRLKRVIARADGFKVPPFGIEELINSFNEVEACKVVSMPDVDHVQGCLPQANIILKEEYKKDCEKIKKKIMNACEEKLPEYQIPADYIFVDDFPRTPIGKVDFAKMEESNRQNILRRIK